jgi:hypothetical protein
MFVFFVRVRVALVGQHLERLDDPEARVAG